MSESKCAISTRQQTGRNANREVNLLVVQHNGQLMVKERRDRERNRRRQRAGDHIQTFYSSSPCSISTSSTTSGRTAIAELRFPGEIGVNQRHAHAIGTHSFIHAASIHSRTRRRALSRETARRAGRTARRRGLRSRAEICGLLTSAVGTANGVVERTGRKGRTGPLDETLAVPASGERDGETELGSEGFAVGVGTGLIGEDAGAIETLI